jgi:Xaa-Pro aminopeptidase
MKRLEGENALLVLRASLPDQFTEEVEYPYRPDNDLYYLTGVAEPGCALFLSVKEVPDLGREALFVTPPDERLRVWIGDRMTREQAAEKSGIEARSVLDIKNLGEQLRKLRPRAAHAHPLGAGAVELEQPFFFAAGRGFLPGRSPTEPYGFLLETFGSGAFHFKLSDPGRVTLPLRQIKSAAEISHLKKAIDATCRAQRNALRAIRPGLHEFELRALVEATFLREGCAGWGFPPILCAGKNTLILHHETYDRRIEPGDLVLLDIGAEFGFYSADVTRTVPAGGRFSRRQREVYQAVLDAQEATIRSLRPGVPFGSVNETATREVAAGLKRLGLIKEDSEARKYFPHGVSHGLGLDVHDPMPLRELAPGMVITVEPGIYIPEEGFGVRIEDDVLITGDGAAVLSASAPRDVEEIEALMALREF